MPAEELLRLADHLRRILPTGIIVEATSEASVESLLPEEVAATQDWAPHRRLQFASGRTCARRALAGLGYPPLPILFDAEGAPLWPSGAVGSISHKREHCIVVVARSSEFSSLGVDLERDEAEPEEAEIIRRVCRTSEQRQAMTMQATRSPGTLFLSAKEAFFKFQFPLTRAHLDWPDVQVTFDQSGFDATVGAGRSVPVGRGVFVLVGGWLATIFC